MKQVLFVSILFSMSVLGLDRDPFLPVVSPKIMTSKQRSKPIVRASLQLTGIAWDDHHPVAFIRLNQRPDQLQMNQRLGLFTVSKITKTTVLLKSRTKKIILKVGHQVTL